MAWNYYPPIPEDANLKDLPARLHAHADMDVITLLYQRPEDRGLEIAPGKEVCLLTYIELFVVACNSCNCLNGSRGASIDGAPDVSSKHSGANLQSQRKPFGREEEGSSLRVPLHMMCLPSQLPCLTVNLHLILGAFLIGRQSKHSPS